jgi:hypothetical protein
MSKPPSTTDDEKERGFSSLSGMVSNVDIPPVTSKPEHRPSPTASAAAAQTPKFAAKPATAAPSVPSPRPQSQATAPHNPPLAPQSKGTAWTAIWIIGGLVVLLWLASLNQSNAPMTSTTARTTSSGVSQPTTTARPIESTPAPGYDQSLSDSELRYCLAEDIRLNGEKERVDVVERSTNHYRRSDVDHFNGVVDAYNQRAADFNSRCGKYRYYQSVMARVRPEVESRRSQLLQEGGLRVPQSTPTLIATIPVEKRKTVKSSAPKAPQGHVYKCKTDNDQVQYTIHPKAGVNCEEIITYSETPG